ncbi:WD40-repeat-containing domain protein, partial [Piptocephalis cylindrospora]
VILATAGYDRTIQFWEALNGVCYRTIQHPDSQVNRLAISPDRRYLAAAGNQTVRLYDALSAHNTPLTSFTGHKGNVTGIAFSAEGTWMATSSEDGTLKVWDVRSPALQRNYEHHAPVNDVISHPNQGEVVTCDQAGKVRVWDLGEEKCPTEMV